MRNIWVAVSVLAVLATSACAPSEAPAVVPAATPTIAPTAEPEEAAIERVLDGDCSRLLTAEAVSADVGASLTALDGQWLADLEYPAMPQLGGIYCAWRGSAADGPWLSVVVLPSRSFTEVQPTGTACSEGAYCEFGAIESGFQFFGTVQVRGGDVAAVQAAADGLTGRIASSLSSAALPAPYTPEGAWDAAIDCATLDAGRAIPTTLGDPAAVGYQYGGDSEPNLGFYVAHSASGLTNCHWDRGLDGSGASVSVGLMPGGAWGRAEIAALGDSSVVSVPGFDHALVRGNTLHAFTAVNRLELTLDPAATALTLADFYPAATALVAELDAR